MSRRKGPPSKVVHIYIPKRFSVKWDEMEQEIRKRGMSLNQYILFLVMQDQRRIQNEERKDYCRLDHSEKAPTNDVCV